MAQCESWFKQDLKKPIKVQMLNGNLFSQDNQGNLIGVEVFDNGEPASLAGTVSANIIRADGGTVAATGTLSENKCSVVLPAAAYAIPGFATIVIKLTYSGVVTTLLALAVTIYRSSTDTAVDPGTVMPSIQSLIQQINTAIASIPADYSSLWTSLAPAFSMDASYVAGQYVTNNGKVYRFNTAHAAGEWVASEVTEVKLGNEISDLKSAFDVLDALKINNYTKHGADEFTVNAYYDTNGNPHSNAGGLWAATGSIALNGASKLYVKLYQNTTLVSPIVFYSDPGVKSGNVVTIDSSVADGNIAEGFVDIPSNAVYAKFGLRDASIDQFVCVVYGNLTDKILSLENTAVYNSFGDSETGTISQAFITEFFNSMVSKKKRVSSFPNLGYITPNGAIQSDSSGNWGYTDLIQIPQGISNISVKLYYNPSVLAVCVFYNNAGIRISAVSTIDGATSGTVYTGDIPVPDGAYYVRATKRVASGEQYVAYELAYDAIITDEMNKRNCILAETLAKPFVLSGANAIGFGDSMMYGYRSLDQTDVSANPWPNIVKDRLGFNNFTNLAVGGAGFTVGTKIITQMTGKILNTRDYIFIAAGTNDYHYAAYLDAFETAVNEAFDYVDANKGANTKVVVITPINRSQAPGNTNAASLNDYRSILTESALKRGYSVIDGRNFGFPDFAGGYQQSVLPDGLHPNDTGYVMYANHICGLLG